MKKFMYVFAFALLTVVTGLTLTSCTFGSGEKNKTAPPRRMNLSFIE
ncbi:MAG: hypothetical protein LBP26_02125 [Clostridiales bacterium]|jgi:hypothetical protein|nr:hypothetical protein [Clostridiales bacterium]